VKIGTKSLLFGCHQFIWHPITVILAWKELYGYPSLKELYCIIAHDIGYFGCETIDGEDGKRHPELGAKVVQKVLGKEYGDMCLYHSRSYAKMSGVSPSKLCWADKLSIAYDPCWFYLLRARLSGELSEFRLRADESGNIKLSESDETWFLWIRARFIRKARSGVGQV
jgi:hypothetical protein